MTRYYLEVLKDSLSICVDSDINYHHHFKLGDIISINMYSDKATVVFGTLEYDAKFILDWNKTQSAILTINLCITKGYLRDVTIQVERDRKLDLLL